MCRNFFLNFGICLHVRFSHTLLLTIINSLSSSPIRMLNITHPQCGKAFDYNQTGILTFSLFYAGIYTKMTHSQTTGNLQKSSTGDLSTGRAFDSGCICVQSSEGIVNDLTGRETVCHCGVSTCTCISL